MYQYPEPIVVTEKQLAAERAAKRKVKALASLQANTIAGGISGGIMYPHLPEGYNVITLAASGRGRNARGLSAAKRGWGGSQPKGAKRAKKQNTGIKGASPRIARTNWQYV